MVPPTVIYKHALKLNGSGYHVAATAEKVLTSTAPEPAVLFHSLMVPLDDEATKIPHKSPPSPFTSCDVEPFKQLLPPATGVVRLDERPMMTVPFQ